MVGQVVANYRIVGEIGSGAMGAVYRAVDIYLGRFAAVKVVAARFAENREALLRFEREGRAASALAHPNICSVFDIGQWQGRPYIAMELLEGLTLEQRLKDGPMAPDECLEIAAAAAGALEAAHHIGIVHRDIKPANLFLTRRGPLKILDFGLAKIRRRMPAKPLGDAAATMATFVTLPGTVLGTLAYMAPEQLRGDDVDGRADLYALGIVLCEALTGARPVPGASLPALPARLGPVVARLVAVDREARYPAARELREDLSRLKEGGAGAAGFRFSI